MLAADAELQPVLGLAALFDRYANKSADAVNVEGHERILGQNAGLDVVGQEFARVVAREGGTLIRAGHTEAAVDIARLAGLVPAGVICEIMNDDGTMARLPDLVAFAQLHNLKLGTIADLIGHRRRTERLVERVEEGLIDHVAGGEWRVLVYANTVEYQEHIALVKGDVTTGAPPLVRMHAIDLLDDMTGGAHWISLHGSMRAIAKEGRGIVVLMREHRPTALSERVRNLAGAGKPQRQLRDYGIGAQILLDLGVKDMVLLTNTERRSIVGLDGYGLNVVGRQAITASDLDGTPA